MNPRKKKYYALKALEARAAAAAATVEPVLELKSDTRVEFKPVVASVEEPVVEPVEELVVESLAEPVAKPLLNEKPKKKKRNYASRFNTTKPSDD